MKIALVHDYLKEYGGAERVVEALHEMWPEAPLYTAFVDWPSFAKAPAGKIELFKSMDIRPSWVQQYPFIKKFISPLRFLAPAIWGSFDLSDYDVVISSSGWFMCRGVGMRFALRSHGDRAEVGAPLFALRSQKNFDPSSVSLQSGHKDSTLEKMNPDKIFSLPARHVQTHTPLHICYIHHPPRNLYGYATGSDLQKYWPVRVYASIVNFFLRHYDFETAQAVDYFIANSKETARRVEKFYRRDSTVIYPPIDMEGMSNELRGMRKTRTLPHASLPVPRTFFLSVGRLTYAKRIDLAIEACNILKLPLKIVGAGKEEAFLRSIAGPTIEFLGSVSDSELAELYTKAKALIFCALDEDFGMVPVEAMSHGTPVIALAQGGVLETVTKETGVLFEKPEVEELVKTIQQFNTLTIHPKDCIAQAKKFSKDRFKRELAAFVEEKYQK